MPTEEAPAAPSHRWFLLPTVVGEMIKNDASMLGIAVETRTHPRLRITHPTPTRLGSSPQQKSCGLDDHLVHRVQLQLCLTWNGLLKRRL